MFDKKYSSAICIVQSKCFRLTEKGQLEYILSIKNPIYLLYNKNVVCLKTKSVTVSKKNRHFFSYKIE